MTTKAKPAAATGHTPGPWHVIQYRDSGKPSLHIAAGDGRDRFDVAQALAWCGDGADQAGANARLIAAAPDLLAACQFALDYIGSQTAGETQGQLRAAIRKATGA